MSTAKAPDRHPRAPLLLLLPVVLGLHLWLSSLLLHERFGLGAADRPATRIEVAFVRELQPAAPPAAPPLRAPRHVAAVPAPAASAALPEPVASEAPVPLPPLPELALAEVAPARAPEALAPPVPDVAAAVPAHAASAPATPPAVEWPPSTRLNYILTGNYRGPVEGQARVEWLLSGARYQVHLEVSIGPAFAPLVTRRLSSDGVVTAAGLEPRRYDEETAIVFRAPRRVSVVIDGDRVRLANGRELPRPPGVQDSASQFVQMTWLFTTQPELLQPGREIVFPLALPRHMEPWTYEVIGTAMLHTPVGVLEAVHVRPRRPPHLSGDLTAEFWVAPSLQYLPVRMVIRQDEDTWVDLMLERAPLQAQPR